VSGDLGAFLAEAGGVVGGGVLLVITVLAGVVYALVSLDWSDAAVYGGGAGLIAVIVLSGLPWMEFAPDGAFRRRAQS
jgi:hypothetical protein